MKRLFAWFKRSAPSLPRITVLVPALMLTFMGYAIAVTPDLLVSSSTVSVPFATNQINGISAVGNVVLYTRPFCQVLPGPDGATTNPRLIFQLHLNGTVTQFGTIPDLPYTGDFNTSCAENYIAIAPGQGLWAAKAGYVYVT